MVVGVWVFVACSACSNVATAQLIHTKTSQATLPAYLRILDNLDASHLRALHLPLPQLRSSLLTAKAGKASLADSLSCFLTQTGCLRLV